MGGPNIAMLNAAVALLLFKYWNLTLLTRTRYCQRFIRGELYFVLSRKILSKKHKKVHENYRKLSKRIYTKLSWNL